MSPLEKTTMTHLLCSYQSRVTNKLAPKIRTKGTNSNRCDFINLKFGRIIQSTYHRKSGPINKRKVRPTKMNMGSRSSPKFSITDFPIRKAIKISINPRSRSAKLFFFLKNIRYKAKSIPCRSPALLRTINATSETFKIYVWLKIELFSCSQYNLQKAPYGFGLFSLGYSFNM